MCTEAVSYLQIVGSSHQPKPWIRLIAFCFALQVVEAALKTRPGRRAALKTGAVRDALDQAETMLESALGQEAQPFLASAQNWRALHVRTAQQGGLAGNRSSAKAEGGDIMSIEHAPAVKRMLGEAYRWDELSCRRGGCCMLLCCNASSNTDHTMMKLCMACIWMLLQAILQHPNERHIQLAFCRACVYASIWGLSGLSSCGHAVQIS